MGHSEGVDYGKRDSFRCWGIRRWKDDGRAGPSGSRRLEHDKNGDRFIQDTVKPRRFRPGISGVERSALTCLSFDFQRTDE